MNKIKKFLNKLSKEEQERIQIVLLSVQSKNFSGLDFKKLKGINHTYRVRTGSYRIIFEMHNDIVSVLDINRRNDNTYRF